MNTNNEIINNDECKNVTIIITKPKIKYGNSMKKAQKKYYEKNKNKLNEKALTRYYERKNNENEEGKIKINKRLDVYKKQFNKVVRELKRIKFIRIK
jgi:hypothetical protein